MAYGTAMPHHWYTMFANILKDMNLKPSPHDPCLFSGIISEDDPRFTRQEIHVGAYVDDFTFYSTDLTEEEKKEALERKFKVNFIVDADFFPWHRFHRAMPR